MDWDYESGEIDPELILIAPVQEEHEEMESYASNEPIMIVSDTESVVRDPLVAEEIDYINDSEAEPQQEFTFKGILWDASWVDQWDFYDDLKNCRYNRDELSEEDPGEDMNHVEDNDNNSEEPTEDRSSKNPSEDSPVLW